MDQYNPGDRSGDKARAPVATLNSKSPTSTSVKIVSCNVLANKKVVKACEKYSTTAGPFACSHFDPKVDCLAEKKKRVQICHKMSGQ